MKVINQQPSSEKTALLKSDPRTRSISSYSTELQILSKVNTVIVEHNKDVECCNFMEAYNIKNEKGQVLFKAKQENNCCSSPFEDIFMFDTQERPVLQIEKTELCGYISTAMRFTISSPPGNPIGFIMKICGFLEHTKFEVRSLNDEITFSIAPPGHFFGGKDYHVMSEDGKVAQIKYEQGNFEIIIVDNLDAQQKTTLIGLIMILDLVAHEEKGNEH